MSVDISKLYLLATLVSALLGGMLLYFGRLQKMPALNWWGTAYLIGAGAIATWTLIGASSGTLLSSVLGAIGIVSCGIVWNAARVFHGRHPVWFLIGSGVAVWFAASMLISADTPALRFTTGAAIVSLLAGLAAGELWSERRRAMQRRWPALAVPVLFGCVLLMPVLVGDILVGETLLAQSHWVTLFAIELVLYAVGTVFVILTMVSERSVRAHREAAQTDPLTGVTNRRGFAEAAALMLANQKRTGGPVSLLVFDVDRFKSINDRFGHPAGDEILKMFAATVTHTLRVTDLTGRLGGEEFAALLPCSMADAALAAERVRETFATSEIAIDDVLVDTTVSIGVAGGSVASDLATLLVAADAALYQAKTRGRNRVELAPLVAGPVGEAVARKPNVVRRAGQMRQYPV